MIKIILVGFWACLITLAAGYTMNHLREATARASTEAAAAGNESKKTKEINVPKIRDGAVKGYIVTQLSYVVDSAAAKKSSVTADAFVVDEAFRYIYDDPSVDFDHLDTFDLTKMKKTLIKNVNARMKADVVLDMGIEEFVFLSSAQAKQRL
jgi:hypothetical protein